MNHTGHEFSMMLPQDITACYGYRFQGGGGRRLFRDLKYSDLPNGEVAVRVAGEVLPEDYERGKLPSIEPVPKSDQDGSSSRP